MAIMEAEIRVKERVNKMMKRNQECFFPDKILKYWILLFLLFPLLLSSLFPRLMERADRREKRWSGLEMNSFI